MTAIVGEGVSLRGIRDEDAIETWNITGTCVAADVGKAVSQDITAANSAKLALVNESILGELASYENRVQEGIVVGAVARKGYFVFLYTGAAPTLGAGVVGSATPGAVISYIVSTVPTAIPGCRVVEVDTTNTLVTVLFN